MQVPTPKKKNCFVLMPFGDHLKEVYWHAIKPACIQAGFESLRVDELKGPFNINRKIIEHIFGSDAIVADLTGWNANVFYEMGVAHTIDNKTIMIIQKTDQVPFDISTYQCIRYEQTKPGLGELREGIVEALMTIEDWRKQATNPVQEFKPSDAFIPKALLHELLVELRQKDDLLTQSVAKAEYEKLEKELQALQEQLFNKQWPVTPSARIFLRAQFLENVSHENVKKILSEKDFFDNDWNVQGRGLFHQYQIVERSNQKLIVDQMTGLIWQQSGSDKHDNFAEAQSYIAQLQASHFGGYADWRLPTLEEAMSLMERVKHKDLYIDPIFDQKQKWIWTSDKESSMVAWVINFSYGICLSRPTTDSRYVRAVR